MTEIVILLSRESASISESARQGSVPPLSLLARTTSSDSHIANRLKMSSPIVIISSSSDEEDIEEPKVFTPTKQRPHISL